MTIADLLISVRNENKLTQQQLADILGFSKVLIVMVENKTKAPSKKLIFRLAEKLKVHPASIMPLLAFEDHQESDFKTSSLEKKLLLLIDKLQVKLIKNRLEVLK